MVLKKSEHSLRQLKKIVKDLVEENDYDRIFDLAKKDKRALSALISMSYDKSSELSWKAIHTSGRIIGSISRDDDDKARGQVRRIIWNTSDESGTIAWTAPEILGEVVRENPAPFEDIVPIILGLSDSEVEDNIFLAGVLYAIGRIGEKHMEFIDDDVRDLIIEELENRDPDVCGNALVASKRLNISIPGDIINKLKNRSDTAQIYYEDRLLTTSIQDLLEKLEFV